MITHTLKRLPKATLEIDVQIPWEEVDSENKKSFDLLQQDLVIEGFRKGKVPKALAQKHIAKAAIVRQSIHTLLPRVYDDIVKKKGLKPIISPKIDLLQAEENKDWTVKIVVAEKPVITLGDYKKVIADAKKAVKKADIWVPGKDQEPAAKKAEENKQEMLNLALTALLKHVKFELSDLIIDEEVNAKLSRLVDDVQKVGLSMDDYLKSRNLTSASLRKQLSQETEETYKLEFILMEIADIEHIVVDQADLDKVLSSIKDDKDRQNAASNIYYYASILRKQKTLEFIISL